MKRGVFLFWGAVSEELIKEQDPIQEHELIQEQEPIQEQELIQEEELIHEQELIQETELIQKQELYQDPRSRSTFMPLMSMSICLRMELGTTGRLFRFHSLVA